MTEPAAADALPAQDPSRLAAVEPGTNSTLSAWWSQGARAAFFLPVTWAHLKPTPTLLLWLWLTPHLLAMAFERLAIVGPADFYWPALLGMGWLGLLVNGLVCWRLAGEPMEGQPPPREAKALFAMLCATALPLTVVLNLLLLPFFRDGSFTDGHEQQALARALWVAGLLWLFGAQAVLLWRASRQGPGVKLTAITALVVTTLALQWYLPLRHWYPIEADTAAAAEPPGFKLTQEVMEAHGAVLQRDLAALAPQKPKRTELYAITFAPDATEDVFQRESTLVAEIMSTRFGAAGRTVQLVSRFDAQPQKAWATPLNLQRAIEAVAKVMDRDDDVLFIHLTSHGARNGELAPSMWPLDVDAVTPLRLKGWLDAAGIRHRVISVSACYSGSWIAPLSGDSTLVMTAADADHTSYGCGRRSELTYFGRAVFDEQLRQTRSFEQAHAAAREVIREREKAAKKDDGYSNPQIAVGAAMRDKLALLVQQLESAGAR